MAFKTLLWGAAMMLMTVVSTTHAQISLSGSGSGSSESDNTTTLYGTGSSSDEFESTPATITQLQYNLLTAVNAQRRNYSLPPLCMNSKLLIAAQLHSNDQASHDTMSHTGSDGSTMRSRILAQGFTSYLRIGENVAAGQSTVTKVMTAWMNSPGHRANILGDYTYFGCGYAYTSQGMYHYYWTQDFGKATAEVCSN